MQTITLSQLQKNIALIGQLKAPLQIFDGRKKRSVATVYPTQNLPNSQSIMRFAGSMHSDKGKDMTMREIRDSAKLIHYQEKYGLPPRR